ncbi:hypothetical protein [Paenibacillus alkalitolerans]|uniref:hypothetical protein n=1 Tax=Paenibacillus alkalitolerans TaxID=2799335 RepID=UPI0018F745E4|nr:hypothetical protein [Paenibacillus alkalitolerans]
MWLAWLRGEIDRRTGRKPEVSERDWGIFLKQVGEPIRTVLPEELHPFGEMVSAILFLRRAVQK